MAVNGLGLTVGGPSGVGDTSVALKDLVLVDVLGVNVLLQELDLADLLEDADRLGRVVLANVLEELVAIDSKTGRVVTTVLLSLKTLNECAENVTSGLRDQVVDVSKDSTRSMLEGWTNGKRRLCLK